jgi:nucleoside-diphosphate-sugar epimerase
MEKLSLFGAGFIGGNFAKMFPDEVFIEDRNSLVPTYNNVLYMRGTTSNYNVFSDISKDVRDNLLLFTETLKNITSNHNFTLISSWFCETPKLGFYSLTKQLQEKLLESYYTTILKSNNFKIIRLSNVIGGDPKASNKKNALEFLVSKIKNNEDIDIYSGDNFRDFISVHDCCRAIKLVMEKGNNGETYNIGMGVSNRIIDLCEYCIDKIKSKSKINIIPAPIFHSQVQIKDYFMDCSKLQDLEFEYKDADIKLILDRLCA